MKKLIFIFLLFVFLYSCSQDKENISNTGSWETIWSFSWTKLLTWSQINEDISWIKMISWSVVSQENILQEKEEKKPSCSITLLSPYPKKEHLSKEFFEYANTIRVFSIKNFSDCKNNELNIKNWVTIPLSKWIVMNIIDTATDSFGSHVGMKNIKTQKISPLSGITLWEKCRESIETWEDECFWKWIIWNFWSLIFTVNSWLTQSNMYEIYDEVKILLESIEEQNSIKQSFHTTKVDFSQTSVVWNTIFLKDSQWWEKEIPISFSILQNGTFQDVLSQMDVDFSKIEWNNLHINVFYWNAMKWFTYYNIIVDIDSWKTIKFETTYEDPEY